MEMNRQPDPRLCFAADGTGADRSMPSPNKWGLSFILNTAAPQAASDPMKEEKKRRRMCKVAGCTKYIVQMGRCCRHGHKETMDCLPLVEGEKKCLVDGCSTGAKHRGLCWNTAVVPSTRSRAATRRRRRAACVCWSHGGGSKCQHPGCTKVTISKGFCWARGGGKRCLVSDCIKPAFERTHNFCQMHHKQLPREARVVQPRWSRYQPVLIELDDE